MMCRDSCRKLTSKSLEEFRILMKTYESTDNFQQKMALKLFTAFDTKRRGSVSQIDFKNVCVVILNGQSSIVRQLMFYVAFHPIFYCLLRTQHTSLASGTICTKVGEEAQRPIIFCPRYLRRWENCRVKVYSNLRTH